MVKGRHTPSAQRPVDSASPRGAGRSRGSRPSKRARPISPEPFTDRPSVASCLRGLLVLVAVLSLLCLLGVAWTIWRFDYDLGHPRESGFSDWQR